MVEGAEPQGGRQGAEEEQEEDRECEQREQLTPPPAEY